MNLTAKVSCWGTSDSNRGRRTGNKILHLLPSEKEPGTILFGINSVSFRRSNKEALRNCARRALIDIFFSNNYFCIFATEACLKAQASHHGNTTSPFLVKTEESPSCTGGQTPKATGQFVYQQIIKNRRLFFFCFSINMNLFSIFHDTRG